MDANRRLFIVLALGVIVLSQPMHAQVSNYIVGPQDVLTITVYQQQDLTGKYTVEADGSFTFPLIGRLTVGGSTLREVEAALRKALSDGFFRNPQISVAVEQYRSQRVFVVGEVRTPGAYSLTGNMTLIEVIARAGSTTDAAGGEAHIVRSKSGVPVDGPLLPGKDEETTVIRVDLRELQTGRLSQNIALQDNDTIFVPKSELVYVLGQVKNPGAFPFQRGTTVQQALALAGGLTDRGAIGRIRVVRTEDGKRVDARVGLEEPVRAGDTITVPERFF